MNHLVKLVVAAMTGLLLVACGEQAEKKPDVTVEQTVAPATTEAAPEAAPEVAAPAEAAPEAAPEAAEAPKAAE